MAPSRRQFLGGLSCAGAFLVAPPGHASASAAPGRVLLEQDATFPGARAGDARDVEGISLRWCPAGSFVMGSPSTEPERRSTEEQVSVRLTRGFFAGTFEVTQAQWRRVMGPFPGQQPSERFGLGDDRPAYWITFEAAEQFTAEITRRAHESGSLPRTWRFSLPTEAQWEYACRAGTTSAWAFGDALDSERANFSTRPPVRAADAVGGATRVGRYSANAWGLHDMHGNVWEWCRDWFHGTLPGGTDPDLSNVLGMQNRDGSYPRVRRGGAWIESAAFCRSACRLPYEPHRDSDHIGFRVFVVQD